MYIRSLGVSPLGWMPEAMAASLDVTAVASAAQEANSKKRICQGSKVDKYLARPTAIFIIYIYIYTICSYIYYIYIYKHITNMYQKYNKTVQKMYSIFHK